MELFRVIVEQSNLYVWGLVLILGIPLLVLLLGEWIERWRQEEGSGRARLATAIRNVRNLILPLLATRLILAHIFQIEPTQWIVRVVETLLWLVVVYVGLHMLTLLIHSPGAAAKDDVSIPRVWGELLRMGLVVGVSFYVLGGLWGAPMDQIVAALGVGSIVIGFALQDTLSSLVSGVLLAFEKPFEVGHWLRYGLYEGQVIEMNWRAVRLRTRERDIVILPNGLMSKDTVINMTLFDPLHAELIPVSFDYDHPPNQIKQILLELCLATPGVVHDPAPHIRIIAYDYNKHATNYEIKLFIIDYLHTEFIRDEILTRVFYATQRNRLMWPHARTIFYQRNGTQLDPVDDFPQRLQRLADLPYFSTLPKPLLEQLASNAAFHHFGAQEWILPVGAFFSGFYIILEGEVRLVTSEQTVSRQQTVQCWREITRLDDGEFFGELLLQRDQPSPYAIEVTRDMLALFVQRTSFIEVIENNPRLAAEMTRLIEEREKLLRRVKDDKVMG